MRRYDIALFILLMFFFITAKRTRKALKPLRSGSIPQAKEIEAFGEAATFFVSSVYMMIWWLIFRHVNICLPLHLPQVGVVVRQGRQKEGIQIAQKRGGPMGCLSCFLSSGNHIPCWSISIHSCSPKNTRYRIR